MRFIVVTLALLACGCGSNARVTGKIERGGATPAAVPGMRLNVAFHPVAEGSAKPGGPDMYAANIAPDGTFNVPGPDGGGIPPGKYRVSVTLRAAREKLSAAEKKAKYKRLQDYDPDKDLLNDAFGPDNSPIIREITGSTDLRIDLDKPAP